MSNQIAVIDLGLYFQAMLSSEYKKSQILTKDTEANLNNKFTIKGYFWLEGTSGGHLVDPHRTERKAHFEARSVPIMVILYTIEMVCKTFLFCYFVK